MVETCLRFFLKLSLLQEVYSIFIIEQQMCRFINIP